MPESNAAITICNAKVGFVANVVTAGTPAPLPPIRVLKPANRHIQGPVDQRMRPSHGPS
ncbi:hypothetical protein ABIB25_004946 [Nakamurella sp. UYEF19]